MLFTQVLERLLNQYLQLDEEIYQQILAFHPRVLRVTITTINLTFYLSIEEQGIKVMDQDVELIDASITASAVSLLQSWCDAQQGKTVLRENLTITGDTHFIQTLNKLFQRVEIDWEELLAKYLGDTVAHQLGQACGQWLKSSTAFLQTSQQNTTEVLQEEWQWLAHPLAVEQYCQEVDTLRDDVERLEIKINRLVTSHVQKS